MHNLTDLTCLLLCSQRVPSQGPCDQQSSRLWVCGVQGGGGLRLCEFGVETGQKQLINDLLHLQPGLNVPCTVAGRI